MRQGSNEQRRIKDPCVLKCSTDKVKQFKFIRNKDFLYDYMSTMKDYKKKREKLTKLARKLPSIMYLKLLQSLRCELMSDLALLKENFSDKIVKKFDNKENSKNKKNVEDKSNKAKNNQRRLEIQENLKKFEKDFKSDFDFFKGNVEFSGKNYSRVFFGG